VMERIARREQPTSAEGTPWKLRSGSPKGILLRKIQ
jgi:hypothetical protein